MSSSSPSPIAPVVDIVVRTDPGRDPDKQVNEDSSAEKVTAHGLLAVVCDGMGGHAGGKEASELAIRTIFEVVEAAPQATPPGAALKRAIEEANARIWSMPTAEAGFRPGSTVVAVLLHDGGAEVAHVGDSRLYLIHAGAISQVTRDHSMVQEMVDRNLIRAEDAAKHPDANKILRALGIAKEVEVDLRSEPLAYVAGDVLILCSDGLSDLVEPAEILELAGSHPPAQAAGQLVDLANARGGHDNITAMVIRLKSSATAQANPTVLKTMPLTAHAMPLDLAPGGGGGGGVSPGGTLLSAPLGSGPPTAPLAHPHAGAPLPVQGHSPVPMPPPTPQPLSSGPAAAIPPFSDARPSVHPRRTGMLAFGIILAIIAVGILGATLFFTTRPGHKSVKVVDDPTRDAAADDDDAGPDPAVAPAPTLPDPSAHHHRDGGGTHDPCGALQRAREHDASAATIDRLTEKCRTHPHPNAVPTPTPTPPSPHPTPTPTPTPTPKPAPPTTL